LPKKIDLFSAAQPFLVAQLAKPPKIMVIFNGPAVFAVIFGDQK
jgi:hypothetical protein